MHFMSFLSTFGSPMGKSLALCSGVTYGNAWGTVCEDRTERLAA